jgi:hypothetical protein
MFHDATSANFYDQYRRRRRWSLNSRNGMQGYAAYLSGFGEGGDEISPLVGAATAAYEADGRSDVARAVYIGVATGVLTFLVNRFLGKVLG